MPFPVSWGGCVTRFVARADGAATNIGGHVVVHIGPEAGPLQEVVGWSNTPMHALVVREGEKLGDEGVILGVNWNKEPVED